MSRPIPRPLLIHGATHRYGTPVESDSGSKTWPSSRTLAYVRFEPLTKLVATKDNKQVQLSALMFFDARNSTPAGTTFAVGDQIQQTNGATYTVETVDALNDAHALHHFELGLV